VVAQCVTIGLVVLLAAPPLPRAQQPGAAGPLVARARAAGYPLPPRGGPAPYYGYLYRILTAQGADAQAAGALKAYNPDSTWARAEGGEGKR